MTSDLCIANNHQNGELNGDESFVIIHLLNYISIVVAHMIESVMPRYKMSRRVPVTLMLVMISCTTWRPFISTKIDQDNSSAIPNHTIIFFGGSSGHEEEDETLLRQIRTEMAAAEDRSTVVLLGNHSGKKGLPDSTSRFRETAQATLNRQLSLLAGFNGKIILVPGYLDWASGGRDGKNRALNLENYLRKFVDEDKLALPQNGCPGPEEIHIGDDLVIIAINTQWYLHGWAKPFESEGCGVAEKHDFFIALDDVLKRNAHKKIIVAGSHPIFSNGRYGGHFPLSSHLLPPGLGSLYVLNRKLIGEKPDLTNPDYRQFRKAMLKVFRQYPNVTYLAGHETSLQYHNDQNQHYLVSGAIGARRPVASGGKASFAHPGQGYGKLMIFSNGDVWLEFMALNEKSVESVYRQKLYNKEYETLPDLIEQHQEVNYLGRTVNKAANVDLGRKTKKPWLLGRNYRPEWIEEIQDVPVFDIGKEKGGLQIIKKGGGAQTYSLRLEDKDGKQWVLRSIAKYPEKGLSSALRGTVYSEILKDQVSASHPYSALTVPKMADAIGVYHTNPKLVYLPDDPRLGIFREQMGDGLFLFEERPDDNREEIESFGRSKNIVSSSNVLRKLLNGDNNYVDQHLVAKSRLFDLLLGDWDRHDDQWRWASFKEENGTLYQPIPRDRDQVFYNGDGALVKIGSRKWISPKIRGFHKRIKFPERLAGNGIFFDRSFLNQLNKKDWQLASNDIQKGLTDEVIEAALRDMPNEAFEWNGDDIIQKLSQRRDDLDKYADRYYRFLAQDVDIVGTSKRDLFKVDRLNDSETRVQVYRTNKNGELKFNTFDRTFNINETKEVRLFGLGHDDRFELSGKVDESIKVRVIGGDGNDFINDQSNVKKGGKKTIVYDTPSGIELQSGKETKKRLSYDPEVNRYDRKAFKYDKLYPILFTESNPDDGLFIGGGFGFIKHGFRQDPAERHTVRMDIAPKSNSFNLGYSLFLADVWKRWDYSMNLAVSEPSFSDYFYGYGNKSEINQNERSEDGQFYRTRYSQWVLQPSLENNFGANKQHKIRLGLRYRSVKIRTSDNDGNTDRFILSYSPAILDSEPSTLLDRRRNYVATTFKYSIDTRNNPFVPSRGYKWNVNTSLSWQLGDEQFNYQQVNSDFSFYLGSGGPFNPVIAARIGGTANFGDFQFYQAARLGGTSNLRGYRKFRFAGDESIYQNTEFRIKLFQFKSRLFPGDFGLNAFHDIGRVWSDQTDEALEDTSLSKWHRGYGGGIWISPLGGVAITTEFTKSVDNDGLLIYLRLGFMF